MFDSEQKLRHLPFFEELATKQEGEASWRAAMAGLVVLRLVDSWLDNGPGVVADDGWTLRSVEAAVDAVDDGTPIRTLLARVITSLQEQKPDIHVVVTPLMAYARSLEYDARWVLAADVYQTVLAHLHPTQDCDASIAAQLRLAECYRTLNRIEEAADAYGRASEIASTVGDLVGVLRARIGEGRIAMFGGNLPQAEQILDETISRATEGNLHDVRSRALHDRSNVAHFRGQYELAVRFAYDALQHTPSQGERDRILSDIAAAFLELGVFSAARDAYLVISVTAQEQYIRWAATLNLIEIAASTGAEPLFERYRRELLGRDLPPYMATGFNLSVGVGYQRFGDVAKARKYLECALALASEHGFNKFLFDAEEAMINLEKPAPQWRAPVEVSPGLQDVAGAIQDLRESAGVS